VARVVGLAAAGYRAIELTTSIPDWEAALHDSITRTLNSETSIGLGTVTTRAQAETATDAGAAFLVSPFPSSEVRAVAESRGIVLIEGGLTPAEVVTAASRGLAKVFPAHVGGPSYLRSLLAIAPGARLIPTGGIGAADIESYLKAGALAVGIGSGLPQETGPLAAALNAAQVAGR
jgi:2-dehydro-3-deoxyphosphogluconate aldolase/(4S)-4-hydroxy-2-oxoglutarate aldolase